MILRVGEVGLTQSLQNRLAQFFSRHDEAEFQLDHDARLLDVDGALERDALESRRAPAPRARDVVLLQSLRKRSELPLALLEVAPVWLRDMNLAALFRQLLGQQGRVSTWACVSRVRLRFLAAASTTAAAPITLPPGRSFSPAP